VSSHRFSHRTLLTPKAVRTARTPKALCAGKDRDGPPGHGYSRCDCLRYDFTATRLLEEAEVGNPDP